MLIFACIGSFTISYPQIVILPSSNGSMPVRHFMVVDLPAPFLPRNPKTSPGFSSSDKSFTEYTSLLAYLFLRWSILSIGGAPSMTVFSFEKSPSLPWISVSSDALTSSRISGSRSSRVSSSSAAVSSIIWSGVSATSCSCLFFLNFIFILHLSYLLYNVRKATI